MFEFFFFKKKNQKQFCYQQAVIKTISTSQITNTTIIASTQTMNQRDSENDNVVQSNTRPAAETVSIRKQCSGVTLNLKLLSHPFIDLTLSTESITEEKGGLAEPPAGRTNVQVGQSNSIRRSTSNANEDIPNKTRVAERDEWHFIALYLSQIVSDCVRHALQLLFLIIIMAVMISIRIVWRILSTCVEVHLQSWQIEEPNKELAPKNCADNTFLRATEDNELAECDSDESEECQKGQTQDVLNSINEAETRAEKTIAPLIEDSIEITESEHILHQYEPQYEEPIQEADTMERQSSNSPNCESPHCVCHLFDRYYSDSDSDQSFDYKVSDIPHQRLQEEEELTDYTQRYPHNDSVGSFYDPYPSGPSKYLDAADIELRETLKGPEYHDLPQDLEPIEETEWETMERELLSIPKLYYSDSDSEQSFDYKVSDITNERLQEDDQISSTDTEHNFHEQKYSEEEPLQHEMPAISRRDMLDVSYKKLTQNNCSRNPSLLKDVLIRNTIRRLEEVQQKESFDKYV